jgi:hypothetical protein
VGALRAEARGTRLVFLGKSEGLSLPVGGKSLPSLCNFEKMLATVAWLQEFSHGAAFLRIFAVVNSLHAGKTSDLRARITGVRVIGPLSGCRESELLPAETV